MKFKWIIKNRKKVIKKMKKETTSSRLKEIMKLKNLKQADIVRMCQPYCERYNVRIQRNDLSQYVSGKFEPKQDKLAILGMALNVSEAWLMGFDVPMSRERKQSKNRLLDIANSHVFTSEEIDTICEYIEFIISKRK